MDEDFENQSNRIDGDHGEESNSAEGLHFPPKTIISSSQNDVEFDFGKNDDDIDFYLDNELYSDSNPSGSDSDSLNHSNRFLVSIIIVLTILVVGLGCYIMYLFNDQKSLLSMNPSNSNLSQNYVNEFGGESPIKMEPQSKNSDGYTPESIYATLAPSVVGVVVYDSNANVVSDPVSEGSGTIINEKGYIVTNSHVVGNSKSSNIKVVLHDGQELAGKVIGYDTKTDIAVIKVDKIDLKAATFGNSDEAKVGSPVLALGNPLGLNFASTLTRGIVSAVNRSLNGSSKSLVKYIQTDAAINPGNSGGPLIDIYGHVIGINSSKIAESHYEGMGFAISSNIVKSVVDDIVSKGYVSGRVRLGLSGKMVSNYQSQIYNVPIGIIISSISKDSNLKSANISEGDIITKINGVNITSLDAFYGELYSYRPGESVRLTVYRASPNRADSKTFETGVVLLEDKGETQESSEKSRIE